LDKYASTMVDSMARMHKFMSGDSHMVVKECCISMFIKDIDNSCLMIQAQQIKEEKIKEREKESKRAKTDDGDFSQSKSTGQ